MKRTALVGLFLGIILGSPSSLVADLELREAATLVQPAVVNVRVRFHARVHYSTDSGSTSYGPYETLAVGSGVIARTDGLVLTNAHVIEAGPDLIDRFHQYFVQGYVASIQEDSGREFSEGEMARLVGQIQSQGTISLIDDAGETIFVPSQIPREINVVLRSGRPEERSGGKVLAAELVASSTFEKSDLAILKVGAKNLPTADLGSSEGLLLEEEILILSYVGKGSLPYRLGEERSNTPELRLEISEAIVSSFERWRDGSLIVAIDSSVAAGSSGGPAINRAGEVIGLYSRGRLTADRVNSGFYFLRPIDLARELAESAGFELEAGVVGARFSAALQHIRRADELESAGQEKMARSELRSALEGLEDVLRVCAHHPDAAKHIARSQAALQRLPQGFEIPDWTLGFGGVVLVVIALLLIQRKRSARENTQEIQAIAAELLEREWKLVGEAGPLAGSEFPIGPSGLVIGRDPSKCQVVYQGETVSRQHARIQAGPRGLLLTNLSKTNKTYLNDQPIQQTAVREGDRIRIGQVVLRIEA